MRCMQKKGGGIPKEGGAHSPRATETLLATAATGDSLNGKQPAQCNPMVFSPKKSKKSIWIKPPIRQIFFLITVCEEGYSPMVNLTASELSFHHHANNVRAHATILFLH